VNRPILHACLALSLLGVPGVGDLQAQDPRIIEWVEFGPADDPDSIALGYPVPVPVDTPLPFAGYRSYNGLHARHQDLAATTPWVHPHEIGTTHAGRTIWAYRLGDEDRITAYGLPEHAMLTNGGIHAREWQSHEVVTGIMELLSLEPEDDHLIGYLRDNANIVLLPVQNVDGYLQTQRFPSTNWIDTDISYPETSPRDGRMRRKNMLGADEDLETRADHLQGVDLNRNNPPHWATNPDRSSDNPESLVYHGAAPQSEPESQALDAAAALGPANRLSMFTDVHSYSQVHFWNRSRNEDLTAITRLVLATLTNHHFAFPAGKYYWFDDPANLPVDQGIGATDGYFTSVYQVPSWTTEIEPSIGQHPGLPGQGADYGGLGRNTHDGFIMPESEVERVRTQMAQSFAVTYYRQAGPPSVAAVRLIDNATGAVVIESEWDRSSDTARERYAFQAQPLQLGRDYTFWLAFDKPMRWREGGQVVPLPGQPASTLDFDAELTVDGTELSVVPVRGDWMDQPGDAPNGYLRYRDDALAIGFSLLADENNLELVNGTVTGVMGVATTDMTGALNDADPATAARFARGNWSGYEDENGTDRTHTGGMDRTISFQVTSEPMDDPFVVEPGTSAVWYDVDRDGEGFVLEVVSPEVAVMYWFTYDTEGNQDWYTAAGEIRGNRFLFPQLIHTTGGEFGPDFDPGKVVRTPVGSASFIWSSCDSGEMKYTLDRDGQGFRQGRMSVSRVTRVMGMPCTDPAEPPTRDEYLLSGSWYDPGHDGEGYTFAVMTSGQVALYWFSFDPQGDPRWFYGVGEFVDGRIVFEDMQTTRGGVFGPDFDILCVERSHWGTMR
jgi:hypothetical protein